MQLTLKSGAQVVTQVTRAATRKNPITQELQDLSCTLPDGYTSRLLYADLGDVSAVAVYYEDSEPNEEDSRAIPFTSDQVGALRSLLDLIHYDQLAQSWRDMLPESLQAALAAEDDGIGD